MTKFRPLRKALSRFANDEDGASTIEFVLVFPVLFFFVLMTFEVGMISLRHVMLERGVDLAVRSVRIGLLDDINHDNIRDTICAEAGIIPDCQNRLRIEMLERNPRDFDFLGEVQCVDLSEEEQDDTDIDGVSNNTLMVIRACARFDPILPTGEWLWLSSDIVENTTAEAAGTYALIATSAFVVEPFTLDPQGSTNSTTTTGSP